MRGEAWIVDFAKTSKAHLTWCKGRWWRRPSRASMPWLTFPCPELPFMSNRLVLNKQRAQ
jgi:hypothetical protein